MVDVTFSGVRARLLLEKSGGNMQQQGKKFICLKLPYPPSCNRSARLGNGVIYTPADVEKYKKQVGLIYMTSRYRGICFPTERIKVRLLCAVKTKARDLDNMFKVAFDALTDVHVWTDDKQIYQINATKVIDPVGYMVITIEEYTELLPEVPE